MIARTIVAFDLLRDALSAIFGLSNLRRSVSIRCQGYIGDFVLGSHAKDMVVLCYNYDNESSDDDSDDDDVEKDEEDEEKEEHLALADPSAIPKDDPVPSS
ncbi:hypothetical protein Tco_1019688 [Tanacetum coccineum]|uniref:Uncharacterized protein n=1 Tax=Tanacetum coccineum TaxID=301880 RepID=A0ABQ5FZ49_9ASTR